MGFNPEGMRRIVRATSRLERAGQGGKVPARSHFPVQRPSGFWAQLTSDTTAATQGAGAGTSVPGDAYAGRYSFQAIQLKADGTVSGAIPAILGDRTQAAGFAREINGLLMVPKGAVVWLTPAPAVPGEAEHYSFRYDLVLLARTKVITTYPTAASAWYGCESLTLSGTQAEGGTATFSGTSSTFFAYNLGTAIPVQGTNMMMFRASIIRSPAGVPTAAGIPSAYWAFRYDG